MISKKLNDLTLLDIQELIDNEVLESKTIEYKSELHIDQGDERKEFLADITSFANANGGDIIYGISENSNTNLPDKICGISIDNEDELIRKIESLLRDSISPRLTEVEYTKIHISESLYVLIIRVGASILSPHRITYKGYDKFFTRNSKGKYPMDVNELRTAFTMSQTLFKAVEDYKMERITEISSNKYQELFDGYPIFVIQIIPISAFRNDKLYSVKTISSALSTECSYGLLNIYGVQIPQKITIDGIKLNHKSEFSYNKHSLNAHYKTNGIVEISTTDFFFPNYEQQNKSPKEIYNVLSSYDLINRNISIVDDIKKYYNKLDVNSPAILSCAIINARGYSLPRGRGMNSGYWRGTIDRDLVLIPDVTVNELSTDSTIILKPIFDAVWNACGQYACIAYSDDGAYIGISENSATF